MKKNQVKHSQSFAYIEVVAMVTNIIRELDDILSNILPNFQLIGRMLIKIINIFMNHNNS